MKNVIPFSVRLLPAVALFNKAQKQEMPHQNQRLINNPLIQNGCGCVCAVNEMHALVFVLVTERETETMKGKDSI